MAEMPAALGAAHLGADHAVAAVVVQGHRLARRRAGEARPAAAALELGAAVEQHRPAAGAAVAALIVIVPVDAGKGPLRAALAQHLVLLGRKALAPLVFG